MVVRQSGVVFDQFRKIASIQAIPFDEILSQLLKKMKRDTDFIGPSMYLFTDIAEDLRRIDENEKGIKFAFQIMKKQQDELANFLVTLNSKRSQEK
jgi:hypothetical protein